jgi:hypothetical protein
MMIDAVHGIEMGDPWLEALRAVPCHTQVAAGIKGRYT